ncbi:MAG: SpoVA/SpoVAEb family sporulation membrane protein [Clostridia bacterium]|nr:SpoVA/SpoVAEb family sporulation membrane protein [Clostridia bacterium]
MELNKKYSSLSDKHAPKSDTLNHSVRAFIGGGAVCLLGELLATLYMNLGTIERDAYLLVTLTFIFIAAALTALGAFDKISNVIFAGTLVPVTGFSNSVTAAAIDTRTEGYVSGVGSKIFTVAGPVILFAAISGTVYGFVYFLTTLFL